VGVEAIVFFRIENFAFITDFVSAGSGGPNGPTGLVFGPNGNLFVSSEVIPGASVLEPPPPAGEVLEYNGTTGAFIPPAFVPAGSGGLSGSFGLVFEPNGNLFVSSPFNDQVLEYDGTTGGFITDFVSAGSGGLSEPTFLTFGPQVSVPEPATLSLIGLCLLSTGLARQYRRFKSIGRVRLHTHRQNCHRRAEETRFSP
jgi:hypothetical protein